MDYENEMVGRSRWAQRALEYPYLFPAITLAILAVQTTILFLTAKTVFPKLSANELPYFVLVTTVLQFLWPAYVGGIATWVIRRAAKNDPSYSLPVEPHSLLIRPLIWLALAAGTVATVVTAFIGGLIDLASATLGSQVAGVSGVVGLVITVRSLRRLYHLPRGASLKIYFAILAPFLLIAVLGILAAIAIPQYQQYERQVQLHRKQVNKAAPAEVAPPTQAPATISSVPQGGNDDSDYRPATPDYQRKIGQEVAREGGYLRHEKEIKLIQEVGHPVPMQTGQCSLELYLRPDGLVQHARVLRCFNPAIQHYTLEAIRDVHKFPAPDHDTEVYIGISYPWAIPVHAPWRYERSQQ